MLDSGAHFYDAYETKDGKYVSIGSIEPQFYAELLEKLGLEAEPLPAQNDRSRWPELKSRLGALFLTKTRDEWCALMEGSDVCFAPVLTPSEAPRHPHNRARGTFVEIAGVMQPRPAPRFSRTDGAISRAARGRRRAHRRGAARLGLRASELEQLRDQQGDRLGRDRPVSGEQSLLDEALDRALVGGETSRKTMPTSVARR